MKNIHVRILMNMIGGKIHDYRYKKGLSQEGMADIIGISTRHLVRIEKGQLNNIKLTTLVDIIQALELNIQDLVDLDQLNSTKSNSDEMNN